MKLYDYYRSSACYRVRIALHLKNIPFEKVEVHLLRDGGEQHSSQYHQINPQGLVPSLEVNGQILHQSLAIIDYLEEIHPNTPLLPTDPLTKARIRALALIIACDIHPLNNLRVLNQLKTQFNTHDEELSRWYHHWLKTGFDAFEAQLAQLDRSQNFCWGNSASLADVCLIPQVYNAHRFNVPLNDYPLINAIYSHCQTLAPFIKAAP